MQSTESKKKRGGGAIARRWPWCLLAIAVALWVLWLCCLPRQLFGDVAYSTVVVDRDGRLLGARVADDGQWRFPPADSVPGKYATAIVEYEDKRFYHHRGVSIQALARALWQNASKGRIVSGGSTITMQTIRLHRRGPRTLKEKVVEMFMAMRLEWRLSKKEILALYASHAPFGGNVVGLQAAMWRYLGSDGTDLSWAEASTLAVLQNAPSLIHLSKNRELLLAKRNALLARLHEKGYIDEYDYNLALDEPLIDEPYAMPQQAYHLVEYYDATRHGTRISTQIDRSLQQRVEATLDHWCQELRLSGVNDLSAVVLDVTSREPIAYCGNSDLGHEREGCRVDVARAPRSSGSTLKPLLYYVALRDGVVLPDKLLPDIPMNFGGFSPKNFDASYSGAIKAHSAIALSLNIPSVFLLKEYGVSRFATFLKEAGFASTLTRPASHYGLSLILGGAEVCLYDLASVYGDLAHKYVTGSDSIDRVALHEMFTTMREIPRTDQLDWTRAVSSRQVAWKTGTSYGSRDAWAVGVTPRYVVAVWAGNADGSGAAGLTGASTAGPVMFDLFDLLPASAWFDAPGKGYGDSVVVCNHSGYRAGRSCGSTKKIVAPRAATHGRTCPYCKEVWLSIDGQRQVFDHGEGARPTSFFTLPPIMEHYYRKQHPEYLPLPPATGDWAGGGEGLRIVYPTEGMVLSLMRRLDGSRGEVVCKAVHRNAATEVFWHLDNEYVGSTHDIHQMAICPTAGYHTLTVVDASGATESVSFVVKTEK